MTADRFDGNMHTFHIPVMGTGFSIDAPLRVAKYGISSVISLVDDVLIEQMRRFHSERAQEPYEAIGDKDEDSRARRITAYLDLLQRLIQRQVEALQASPFEAASEITRYYEMLPEGPLKQTYDAMLSLTDPAEKAREQLRLRRLAVPGSIDVNIMTKLDRARYRAGQPLPPEFCDAMAALRGYAKSSLNSAIVFSAGMNARLYSYIAQFDDFFCDEAGNFKKKVVLKVSDYRSAMVQGKFLAKRGLWVSEYRIESGLNCGGHAFATKGLLMGPILEEFRQRKAQLREKLYPIYAAALEAGGRPALESPPEVRITAQGGIGTAEEDRFLLTYYRIDGTGWATPFLLVPEVTNVDEAHLQKLLSSSDRDVYLSDASPLGIPFWTLRDSASEEARRQRIQGGKPGSACPKGFLVSNTEFTDIPICHASRVYQRRKLAHLAEENLSAEQLPVVEEHVVAKSCICHDLAGGATIDHGIDPQATTAVCCGPNIANFSKVATLQEMVSHIYGRVSLLANPDRPHMFIRELKIYVDYLRDEIKQASVGLLDSTPAYFREFKENLLEGIEYYRGLAERFVEEKRNRFLDDLQQLREALEPMLLVSAGGTEASECS
ncbi:MAG: hypothetical protein ACE5GE_04105 [Phycisphaerae bacterium]